jgi:hypothetical protein
MKTGFVDAAAIFQPRAIPVVVFLDDQVGHPRQSGPRGCSCGSGRTFCEISDVPANEQRSGILDVPAKFTAVEAPFSGR